MPQPVPDRPTPPPPDPPSAGRHEVSPRLLASLVLLWYLGVALAHYRAFFTHR